VVYVFTTPEHVVRKIPGVGSVPEENSHSPFLDPMLAQLTEVGLDLENLLLLSTVGLLATEQELFPSSNQTREACHAVAIHHDGETVHQVHTTTINQNSQQARIFYFVGERLSS